jgi:hypothetical protein
MKKLLADGKTDLLKEFVSNRTRRKFSAYLVVQDGKVGFEFEKKAPAKKKAGREENPRLSKKIVRLRNFGSGIRVSLGRSPARST